MKRLLKNILASLGYSIRSNRYVEKQEYSNPFTMEMALQRCVSRGLNIKTVIDVGASDSRWSQLCMRHLPNADYLLIEAQEPHKVGLEDFKSKNKNADYILAAAGEKDGKIYFDNSGLFGGVASETPFEENCIEVPVISVDEEVKRRGLRPPYLIKLDTHGFEIPILDGAKNVLHNSELVIIESYNYQLTNNSLRFYELCSSMENKGFFPIEVADFMLREFDHSFWQMDTFFIPKSRKEFLYRKYQ